MLRSTASLDYGSVPVNRSKPRECLLIAITSIRNRCTVGVLLHLHCRIWYAAVPLSLISWHSRYDYPGELNISASGVCVWSVSITGMIVWGRRGYIIRTELYVKQKGDCNVSLPDMPIRPSSYYATADEGDMDQMSRSRAVEKMVSIGYGYM